MVKSNVIKSNWNDIAQYSTWMLCRPHVGPASRHHPCCERHLELFRRHIKQLSSNIQWVHAFWWYYRTTLKTKTKQTKKTLLKMNFLSQSSTHILVLKILLQESSMMLLPRVSFHSKLKSIWEGKVSGNTNLFNNIYLFKFANVQLIIIIPSVSPLSSNAMFPTWSTAATTLKMLAFSFSEKPTLFMESSILR